MLLSGATVDTARMDHMLESKYMSLQSVKHKAKDPLALAAARQQDNGAIKKPGRAGREKPGGQGIAAKKAGPPGSDRDIRCYKCYGLNHTAKSCASANVVRCDQCGGMGHRKEKCTTQPPAHAASSKDDDPGEEEDEACAFSGAASTKPKYGPSNSARYKGGQYDTLEG